MENNTLRFTTMVYMSVNLCLNYAMSLNGGYIKTHH
jgi:hypothetical protein